MNIVPLPQNRSTVTELSDRLRIEIPAKKQWPALIFLCFWLCGWAVGEITVLLILLGSLVGQGPFGAAAPAGSSAAKGGGIGFMLIWFTMWTLGGGAALFQALWMAAGREIIEVDSHNLRLGRALFGWTRWKDYPLEHVSNLRPTPVLFPHAQQRHYSYNLGQIAFDYGAKMFRFGAVDEPEAKELIEAIEQRIAFYGARSSFAPVTHMSDPFSDSKF